MRRLKQPIAVFGLSVAVVAIAFFLRFSHLPDIPFGWHIDEAIHGLEARDVLRGDRPVFFTQFTGHEALYIYAMAGAFTLFGDSIWSARLVSATAGLLTVALTIPLGAVLWPRGRGRRIGQWAALLLAVSIWHLIASRNSYRAVLQPLFQLPALIFLIKAIRHSAEQRGRVWAWWMLAGLFTGLNIHTYLAARAFPLVVAIIGLAAVLIGPDRAARLKGLLLEGGVAALVILPLALHFYFNPADFYGRAADVSIWTPKWTGGDAWGQLWRNGLDTVGMFMSRGDPSYKHNIGYRPVFDPVLGVLFFAGLAYAAWGLFRSKRRLVSLTLLSWLLVMQLPMVLSAQGIPHYLRSIGVLPVVMVFPALVLDAALSTGQRWASRRFAWTAARAAAVIAVLLAWAGLTVQARDLLFNRWHGVVANDIERVVQAAYLVEDLQPVWQGEPVYLSTTYPLQTIVAYLSPPIYAAARGFDARWSLPLPPEGTPTNYYVLLEDPPNEALLERAGLRYSRTATGRFGQPVYAVYQTDGQWPEPRYTQPMGWSWDLTYPPGWMPNPLPAPVSFQNALLLLGYDLSAEAVSPGEALTLTLYWELLGPTEREYSMFAHVLDAQGGFAGEYDGNHYPATHWRAGELLVSEFPMTIWPDTPPGLYQLEVGVYHQATNERLQVLIENVEPVSGRLLLQPITVK